jgi:hypothetical protein
MITQPNINRLKESHDLYARVNSWLDEKGLHSLSFGQIKYHFNNSVDSIPICECGKVCSFISSNIGYTKTCSRSCGKKTDAYKAKVKKTCLEKYGVENPAQSDVVKDKMKSTVVERYGVEHASQNSIVKEKIRNKSKANWKKVSVRMKQASYEKYGVDHFLKAQDIIDKRKSTLIEKYGVDNISKSPLFKELKKKKSIEANTFGKMVESYKKSHGFDNPMQNPKVSEKSTKKRIVTLELKTLSNHKNIKFVSDDTFTVMCNECDNEHDYIISKSLFFLRKRFNKILCVDKNPINNKISSFHVEVLDYIKSVYAGAINVNIRDIIKPYELDIFIPELNIAIECNGLYWHSELYRNNQYHLDKTNKCISNNIQLFHIWEDDWVYKRGIVESMLSNAIGKTTRKIYARKCAVKTVNNKEYRVFLDENHLQGYVNAKLVYGLYYDNDLVSVMSFGHERRALGKRKQDNVYELLRFASKLNTSVVGAASKLFKYFTNNNNFSNIITYANKDWSSGNVYRHLGFSNVGETGVGYHYIVNNIREHRYKYRKSILLDKGFGVASETEHQIMYNKGYYRIYNAGNSIWEFKNSSFIPVIDKN